MKIEWALKKKNTNLIKDSTDRMWMIFLFKIFLPSLVVYLDKKNQNLSK